MSGNPVFNERRFTTIANSVPSNEVMTIEGALQKASILFGALLVGMLVMFAAYASLDASTPGAGMALAGVAATIGGDWCLHPGHWPGLRSTQGDPHHRDDRVRWT